MSVFQGIIIFMAAIAAGGINSIPGGGTLLSYPALIAIGVDPLIANATSTVALVPGSFSSMLGYRKEMAGTGRWILILGVPSLIGGGIGAVLLLMTPSKVFAAMVPWLILGATLLRASNGLIMRWLGRAPQHEPSTGWWVGAIVFQFFVAIYGGYFGAGIGILMLAAFGLLGLTDIHWMNGLKTVFGVLINGVASAYFIFSGKVLWSHALLMAVGAVIGGYGGASLARYVGRKVVNYAIVVIGLGIAVALFFWKK